MRDYVAAHVVRGSVADAGEGAAVLHVDDRFDHGHIAILGGWYLDEIGVYAAQASVVSLVEEAGKKDVLFALAHDHELVAH